MDRASRIAQEIVHTARSEKIVGAGAGTPMAYEAAIANCLRRIFKRHSKRRK